ncbi:hypothetical protein FRC07_007270 [Ceratobasidium sp. 392]|nr:hypothetical protein FRC07_007270 [Ceratobasidium sp. 392]
MNSVGAALLMICAEDELLDHKRAKLVERLFQKRLLPSADQVWTAWMMNKELLDQTDLVKFLTEAPATMLLASGCSMQPVGKPLPGIETFCLCKPTGQDANGKSWVFNHNAQHGCPVKDV